MEEVIGRVGCAETSSREPSRSVSALSGFDPARRPPALGMGQIMLAAEEDCGRKAIWPHHKRLPTWFTPGDWQVWPVISYSATEVHIVAISSARKGALRRLIEGAAAAGLSPVIVEPMGPAMSHILSKGWRRTFVGEGWDRREEWRPAIATEARRAETPKSGSVHEGAGPKDIAQPQEPTP